MNKVVTRFAPSPTGLLHAGNYRTAVFAYLFAKHAHGSFILRIEDTDKERSRPEYETNILEALAWLQLDADQRYRQSANAIRHRELLEKLVSENTAYVSKETPRNPGDREEVIRFRNPGGKISFVDIVRGEIAMDVGDLGDFIIARSFDEPVFHFAVVVDDADEGVTHVIRGEDHIANTPRQMLIQRALGLAIPAYVHLPLILGSDRSKLSKRKGAKALTEYRDLGILPEAMLNYLALLGWNPGNEREYLSRKDLVEIFDLSRIQKGGAVFDETKLLSVNQHWMRTLSDDDFLKHLDIDLTDFNVEKCRKAVPLLKERTHTFTEAREMLSGELSCLFAEPALDRNRLLAKELEGSPGLLAETALGGLLEAIKALPEGVSADAVKEAVMPFADAEEQKRRGGRGAVLWPLRYALSGADRSPDPFTLISILGPEESISRMRKAIGILKG
ncbi:MAG: glutamate--tRNA ligase [Patescibacteria group bacterium]|nr:glutamate--tRNA ligase [Patescibacteria group bacterium]